MTDGPILAGVRTRVLVKRSQLEPPGRSDHLPRRLGHRHGALDAQRQTADAGIDDYRRRLSPCGS